MRVPGPPRPASGSVTTSDSPPVLSSKPSFAMSCFMRLPSARTSDPLVNIACRYFGSQKSSPRIQHRYFGLPISPSSFERHHALLKNRSVYNTTHTSTTKGYFGVINSGRAVLSSCANKGRTSCRHKLVPDNTVDWIRLCGYIRTCANARCALGCSA